MGKHKWLEATCVIALIYLATAISSRAQTFITLHSFNGTDGSYPDSGVVQGADGNFYGTTGEGGTANLGTIFEMTPAGTLTTLQSFSGTNGSAPNGLVLGTDGKFYATTTTTVYSIVPGGTTVVLASVNGSQAH